MSRMWTGTVRALAGTLLTLQLPSPARNVAVTERQREVEWAQTERSIKRLSPSAFQHLPQAVIRKLESEGCSIPQAAERPAPHNVIRGEFAQKGQTDWAVLCSRRGNTSVRVFWGKGTPCPSEFAASEDRHWLQGLGGDTIGYSPAIATVGKKYITDHYAAYGGPKPPPITHQGIDDGFMGKISVVYYCRQGKWIQLQGAD